ncbi:TrmO family methyltransferase, partial [Salmonella enterica subsp. enterica serovar Anatum]|nr:TrmO family methyltransferase [Salmonella enterica subsp. enterica serovar Anatum]
NQADAVRGLEAFSHLWVLFVFHQTMDGGWRPTVRPPRLGGNASVFLIAKALHFTDTVTASVLSATFLMCGLGAILQSLGVKGVG